MDLLAVASGFGRQVVRLATEAEGGLSVPFDKATVKDAPKMDPDGQLSHEEEAELYRHYGRDYSSTGTSGRL